VYAIVRGADDAAATKRLRQGFDSGDAELLATYDALSAKHLTVLAGGLHF
jgi:thioester reductase-like protein